MAGRPRKPVLLNKLQGNPGKRALRIEPQGRGDLWVPPSWFNDEHKDEWDYALDHAPIGLLTGADRNTLAVWCAASVEFAHAVVELRQTGYSVLTPTKKGRPSKKTTKYVITKDPVATMYKSATLMLKCASELGFSPSSRAKLGTRPSEVNGGQVVSGSLTDYLEQKPDQLVS